VGALDALAEATGGVPDRIGAAEALTALLGLEEVGLTVTGARIVGRGGNATADLYFSDRSSIAFERLRDIGKPNSLTIELAAATGATPKITGPQAVKAISLIRTLAEHETAFDGDEIAREWGTSFLQAAQLIDVDLTDQAERWAAFCKLGETDPLETRSTGETSSVAGGSIVLRSHDGTRLVRTGWFRAHVRAEESISSTELANRMQRVGWARRGNSGRIKATHPDFANELVWTFYLVPSGWEQGLESESQVNE
jgi:hypothetical protein